MSEPLPLGEGPNVPGKRRPRTWGVELTPIPPAQTRPEKIRVTLVDRETGKRVGAREIPWAEFADVTSVTVLANIEEGVWQ